MWPTQLSLFTQLNHRSRFFVLPWDCLVADHRKLAPAQLPLFDPHLQCRLPAGPAATSGWTPGSLVPSRIRWRDSMKAVFQQTLFCHFRNKSCFPEPGLGRSLPVLTAAAVFWSQEEPRGHTHWLRATFG